MNDQITERIVGSLDKVQQYIESAEGFVLEQAPQVAQEIVLSGRIQAAFTIVVVTLLTLIVLTFAGICWRVHIKLGCPDDSGWLLLTLISLVVSVCMSMMPITASYSAIIPFFAPRLYLLQEIAKLV
jgi:membrane-associated HD superfamily phosphohydrolase